MKIVIVNEYNSWYITKNFNHNMAKPQTTVSVTEAAEFNAARATTIAAEFNELYRQQGRAHKVHATAV